MEILKVGTRVKTYGPTGLNEENATLLERLEDDYSELMNTDDIEIPVHISSLQKWIVRFDGDSKATFARWIDPKKTLSEEMTHETIHLLLSDPEDNETEIVKFDLKNEHEIIIRLESGNTICIGRDEQGDSFVTIDDHELWDNSYRERR